MNNQEIYSQPIADPVATVGLTNKQRWGIYLLIFLVIIILGAWYFQVRRYVTVNMYGDLNPATMNQEALNAQKLQANQARLDATYNTDTDGDGIPDWEEINIYKTSPYLADTDGDGIPDGVEIKNHTDPNCPEGKTCIGSMTSDQVPVDNTATTTAPNVGQDQLQLLKQAFGDNPDTAFLRSKLLAAASTEEQKSVINGLTDQQLIDFYKQMIQGQAPSKATTSATGQ